MKKKDRKVLLDATIAELDKKIADREGLLARTRVNRYTKPSKNTREVRTVRHEIAILKTYRRAKEIQNEK